jgi:hypothetical protein
VTDRLLTAAERADRLALSTSTVLDWSRLADSPAFFGAIFAEDAIRDDDAGEEARKLTRVLVPWVLLAVVVTAWVASERPWVF